jgi:hypothetical protein
MRIQVAGGYSGLAGLALAAILLVSGQAGAAPYEFTFTVNEYALEQGHNTVAMHYALLENTGSLPDTIDLALATDLPPGWSATLCIGGKCTGSTGSAYLDPGETEDVEVMVFVGPSGDLAVSTLTGTMRHDPGESHTEIFAAFANTPSILVVDDDGGDTLETHLDTAVQAAGYRGHVWDADSLGRPGSTRLQSYWVVLWTTGAGDCAYLTGSDEQDMMDCLDQGGNLFLAGTDFLSSRGGATTFTDDYLKIASWTDDTGGTVMSGVASDPISDGMSLSVSSGPVPASGIDNMVLGGAANAVFSGAGTTCLRVEEGGHRVVFASFPFENVSTTDPDPDNQTTLISRIIAWFDPPMAGLDGTDLPGGMIRLGQNAPNPFGRATAISFAVPPGSRDVELAVFDIRGRVVRTLMSGGPSVTAGTVTWNGRDDRGSDVASGIYFYRLAADGRSILRKMVLVR